MMYFDTAKFRKHFITVIIQITGLLTNFTDYNCKGKPDPKGHVQIKNDVLIQITALLTIITVFWF